MQLDADIFNKFPSTAGRNLTFPEASETLHKNIVATNSFSATSTEINLYYMSEFRFVEINILEVMPISCDVLY